MKIIAMITARSTSSRFPRKHLAMLGGKPMIVQILNNLKGLSGISEIVLATTTNPEDDDLVALVKQQNCDVVRGSEDDLTQRHGAVLDKYNPDAVLNISGDCPFMDIEAVQAVINACNEHPYYDTYGIRGAYSRSVEMFAGIHSASWFLKLFDLYKKHPLSCSADQYWLVTQQYPKAISAYTVDGSKYMDKTVTPIKMSVDWELERQFYNAIIDHLGYYPIRVRDFDKAFREMKDMDFVWSKK